MFDYRDFKRETMEAANKVGLYCSTPLHIEWLTSDQLKRLRGKNIVTDETWQYRLLANRSILAEISYGWMMGKPVLGLTVFSKDDPESDFDRSKACFTIPELVEALELLNDSDRDPVDTPDRESWAEAQGEA